MTPAAVAELVRSVAHDVLSGRRLDPAALPATITVYRPRDPRHGDYATNVALLAGKRAGVAPREFASWVAAALRRRREMGSAKVAGPGLLNLRLTTRARNEIITQVLAGGAGLGALQGRPTRGLAGLEEHPTVQEAQFVHARLAAMQRHAADLGVGHHGARLEILIHPREADLVRTLGEFPAAAGSAAQPRRLLAYLPRLSGAYHQFEGSCRVLPMGDEEPAPPHSARLALCQATRQVLASGLRLLGVSAPERM
jgi:arginyl-tRNA synthetase